MDSTPRAFLRRELVAVGFVTAIVAASQQSGFADLLFPELAALSTVVLCHPRASWARQPWRLITAPTLTAALGILISRHLPYHLLTVLLAVGGCQLVLLSLRSSLTPAISAGVLPLVLGLQSWLYPLGVGTALVCLRLLLALDQRFSRPVGPSLQPPAPGSDAADPAGDTPVRHWVPFWIGTLAVLALAAQLSGLRYLLVPPLIVVIHDRYALPRQCSWAARPGLLPLLAGSAAAWGLLWTRLLPAQPPLAAALTLVGVVALQHRFRVRLPPLLAISLLPMILPRPDAWFPLAVLLGTAVVALISGLERRLSGHNRAVQPAAGDT